MREVKVDRRVQYTKMVLRESLLELMKEHPINKITITEICRQADINRNTFYTHYNSQLDLLESIEASFHEEIKNAVEHSMNTGVFEGLLYEVCQYIADNGELCKILLSENGSGDFLNRIIYILHDRSIEKWEKETGQKDSSKFEAMYSFISNGGSAIINEWVKNGMQESPKDIAHFIEKAINAIEDAFLH